MKKSKSLSLRENVPIHRGASRAIQRAVTTLRLF